MVRLWIYMPTQRQEEAASRRLTKQVNIAIKRTTDNGKIGGDPPHGPHSTATGTTACVLN